MNAFIKKLKGSVGGLAMPLVALGVLLLFNLIRCIVTGSWSFYEITIATDEKGSILSGSLISIIYSASALAILAMGMTLVTRPAADRISPSARSARSPARSS